MRRISATAVLRSPPLTSHVPVSRLTLILAPVRSWIWLIMAPALPMMRPSCPAHGIDAKSPVWVKPPALPPPPPPFCSPSLDHTSAVDSGSFPVPAGPAKHVSAMLSRAPGSQRSVPPGANGSKRRNSQLSRTEGRTPARRATCAQNDDGSSTLAACSARKSAIMLLLPWLWRRRNHAGLSHVRMNSAAAVFPTAARSGRLHGAGPCSTSRHPA
mmetsp:Transcript_16859/g.41445  ORF Transcript_16859/g.41445 Transcript_16859/m.41445 type:complete len:214 (+) Transcript_16859:215-856(+)